MNLQTPLVAATAATTMPASQDAIDKGIAALVVIVAAVVGDIVSGWLRRRFGSKKKKE
jgi:membrane protein DedA with SNARE-associated domain